VNLECDRARAAYRRAGEILSGLGFEVRTRGVEDPADLANVLRAGAGWAEVAAVAGGDGSLNLAASPLLEAGLPLGILPLGTANDLAASLDIPRDLAEACAVIASGRVIPVNLGRVDESSPFFNSLHVGLSVDVVQGMGDSLKKRLGRLSYLLALTRKALTARPFRARVDGPHGSREMDVLEVVVGNGRYTGGGMMFTRDSAVDADGLYCCAILAQSLVELVLKLPAIYSGRVGSSRKTVLWTGEWFRVQTEHRLAAMADGEILHRTPVRVDTLPRALEVIVPQTYRSPATGG
jgi:YegS/Rv2252/BmrU family lipid kinase